MIPILILFASILLATLKSGVYNRFAKGTQPGLHQIFLFNAISYAIGAVEIAAMGMGESLSWFTALMAFCYAALVFSLQVLSIVAMTKGPMALTSLFVMYGMVLPAISGPLFWGEPLSVWKILGIVVMLASLLLMTDSGKEKTIPKSWWLLAVICFVISGSIGVVEKIHQSSPYRDELRAFLTLGFGLMVAFSLAGLAICKKGRPLELKKVSGCAIATGVIAGILNQVNLWLAGNMDSMVYYPVSNGGALLLTVLASVVIFRENLTKKRTVGFALGLASVILLSF